MFNCSKLSKYVQVNSFGHKIILFNCNIIAHSWSQVVQVGIVNAL